MVGGVPGPLQPTLGAGVMGDSVQVHSRQWQFEGVTNWGSPVADGQPPASPPAPGPASAWPGQELAGGPGSTGAWWPGADWPVTWVEGRKGEGEEGGRRIRG